MIRHHLRGRVEEAWCFVSNACFSSVLSYLSRTPLMPSSAPLSSSLLIVLPGVSGVRLFLFCGASLDDSQSSSRLVLGALFETRGSAVVLYVSVQFAESLTSGLRA